MRKAPKGTSSIAGFASYSVRWPKDWKKNPPGGTPLLPVDKFARAGLLPWNPNIVTFLSKTKEATPEIPSQPNHSNLRDWKQIMKDNVNVAGDRGDEAVRMWVRRAESMEVSMEELGVVPWALPKA